MERGGSFKDGRVEKERKGLLIRQTIQRALFRKHKKFSGHVLAMDKLKNGWRWGSGLGMTSVD